MGAFMEEGMKAGVFISGEGLQPSSKSARVQFSGSKRLVIDGPFAETKELIAGYAILQFTSKEEAIEWTKRFAQVDAPGRHGGQSECEIREIFEFEHFGPSAAVERFREMGVERRGSRHDSRGPLTFTVTSVASDSAALSRGVERQETQVQLRMP